MLDKIKIHGIEMFAYHGLFEEEKEKGQAFIIDCEFLLDTSLCREDIKKTVHYGDLTLDIVDFSKKNRYALLETLANDLVKYLLQKYNLIKEISLTIHKPEAPIPTEFSDVTLTVKRKRTMVYLGIGSNLGDKAGYLDQVIEGIKKEEHMILIHQSAYYKTAPYGVLDQEEFLNGVVKVETYLSPLEVLEFCKKSEEKAGRVKLRKWGERTLDVDILLYGDEVIFTEELKIPHVEMQKRRFVLDPLFEIEPYLVHPIYKLRIEELREKLR